MMSSKRFYNVRYLNTDSQLVIYYLLRDAKTPKANASVFIHVLDTSCDYFYTVNHSLQKEHENKVSQNILARIVN